MGILWMFLKINFIENDSINKFKIGDAIKIKCAETLMNKGFQKM
jgi:hypothetical protein